MWLTQLPGLVSEPEREQLQRQVQGATPARMLRECAEALAALTVDTPLVLVLEDLHWSDLSTIECLTAVAQRWEAARLLVLGTYRPVDTVLRAHPPCGMVQELCGRRQAVELRLEFLSAAEVAAYVAGRLGGTVAALTKGLTLLATLLESPARAQHELTLRLLLGQPLVAAKGYGAPEVGENYTRPYTLCQQVGEPRQRCQTLKGLSWLYLFQAQVRMAGELSQQFFRLAQHQHDRTLVLEGYMDLGLIEFFRGDPVTARAHLEQSLRLADVHQSPLPLFTAGYEARVTTLISLALVLWMLGYADQAQQRSQEALAQAQQVEHTPSLAWALLIATVLSQHRRDVAATQADAEALMALATVQGFEHRVAQGRIVR